MIGVEVVPTATIGHALETTGDIVPRGQSTSILVAVILIVIILRHSETHGTGSEMEGLLVQRAAETQDGLCGVNVTKTLGKWEIVVYERAVVGRSVDVLA